MLEWIKSKQTPAPTPPASEPALDLDLKPTSSPAIPALPSAEAAYAEALAQHQPEPLRAKAGHTPKYKRVYADEAIKMWRLRSEGLTLEAIAQATSRSLETVHRQLAQFEDVSEAARKLLQHKTMSAAMRWAEVVESGEGNHIPAKELLLHTGVIDPVQGEGSGAKVAVFIGTPDKPVTWQPPQVVDATQVSGNGVSLSHSPIRDE